MDVTSEEKKPPSPAAAHGGDGKDANGSKGGKDGADNKPMDPARKNKLRRMGIGVGLVLLVLAILFGTRYWLDGRFLEDTDDAYLKADAVVIAPKVSGYVTQVLVTDNKIVKAGQPLVTLDVRQYQATLDTAHANIDTRRADISKAQAQDAQLAAALAQARAQRTSAAVAAAHASDEVQRYAPLAASGADSPEHIEQLKTTQRQARASLAQADAAVRAAQQQIVGNRAVIEQARAQLDAAQASNRQAQIDVQDAKVASAIDGRVGDKTVQLGQLAQPGMRLMSVVPTQAIYLVANFKETQVGRMRPGQPATIRVDALSGVKLRGHVESFSPGTGAQFALLQPENATGNFTKIVQRVPVRIAVEANQHTRQLLVPGLSVKVEVDTHSGRDDLRQIKQENEHPSDYPSRPLPNGEAARG
jgi:membrane fusion protein (multidrug efflux system)